MDYGHFVDIEDYDFNSTYNVVYEEPGNYTHIVDSSFNYVTSYIASYVDVILNFMLFQDIE